jgi:galactose mutarotase-like enzyme
MMFLESDSQTKELFPFDFRIEIISEIISNKIIKIIQKIINTGNLDLPSRVGLHPYYFVKNDDKNDLKILL